MKGAYAKIVASFLVPALLGLTVGANGLEKCGLDFCGNPPGTGVIMPNGKCLTCEADEYFSLIECSCQPCTGTKTNNKSNLRASCVDPRTTRRTLTTTTASATLTSSLHVDTVITTSSTIPKPTPTTESKRLTTRKSGKATELHKTTYRTESHTSTGGEDKYTTAALVIPCNDSCIGIIVGLVFVLVIGMIIVAVCLVCQKRGCVIPSLQVCCSRSQPTSEGNSSEPNDGSPEPGDERREPADEEAQASARLLSGHNSSETQE